MATLVLLAGGAGGGLRAAVLLLVNLPAGSTTGRQGSKVRLMYDRDKSYYEDNND